MIVRDWVSITATMTFCFSLREGRKKKYDFVDQWKKNKDSKKVKKYCHDHFGLLAYDTWDLSTCEMRVKKQKDSIKQKHQMKNK